MKSFYIISLFMLIICMITIIQIFNLTTSIDKLKEKDKDIDDENNVIENYNITYDKPFKHHHGPHKPFPPGPPISQRHFIRNFDWQSKFNPFIKQFDRPENYQLGDLNVRRYFDIPTRGPPNDFHIIGTLSRINNIPPDNKDNEPNNETNDKKNGLTSFIDDNRVLNLYGRAKYPNSYSTFEYYTRITSGNEMIKIDLGERKEMLDGDTIHIDELNADYKLKTYPNDMFRYDPFDFRDY